jgi:hypothetical protein
MLRRTAGGVLVAMLASGAIASANSGSLSDPRGDYPDIVKLSFNNASSKVTMKLTMAAGHAQNESFYIRWGSGKHYQAFNSQSAGLSELRYAGKKVACGGLVFKHPSADVTTVKIPRTCIPKAPNKVRFQAIATEGLHSADETKVSKSIARG